jgi:hypothetical protein
MSRALWVPGKCVAFAGVTLTPGGDIRDTPTPELLSYVRCQTLASKPAAHAAPGILLRCAVYHNRAVTLITAPGVITFYDENGIREAASRTERVAP